MSMELTRAADYAVRAMTLLAGGDRDRQRNLDVGAIAEEMHIPSQFLHKVMPKLVGAGLVISKRGAGGGYRLALKPEEIRLLSIVEAVEGPLVINPCLDHPEECKLSAGCRFHGVLHKARNAFSTVLQDHSLADLVPGTPAVTSMAWPPDSQISV